MTCGNARPGCTGSPTRAARTARRSPSRSARPTTAACRSTVELRRRPGAATRTATRSPIDWDFGDGSPHASTATASHQYRDRRHLHGDADGRRTARAGSDTATSGSTPGNHPPGPDRSPRPTADQRFRVGETITLSGSATDPEDGTLPDSALTLAGASSTTPRTRTRSFRRRRAAAPRSRPGPRGLRATTNSYLEVRLTATDSQGVSTTVSRSCGRAWSTSFRDQPHRPALEVNGTGPGLAHLVGGLER